MRIVRRFMRICKPFHLSQQHLLLRVSKLRKHSNGLLCLFIAAILRGGGFCFCGRVWSGSIVPA